MRLRYALSTEQFGVRPGYKRTHRDGECSTPMRRRWNLPGGCENRFMPATPEERGRRAEKRAQELADLRGELTAGRPSSPKAVERARERAAEARQRSKEAHHDAAERHREASRLHEEAATVHEHAAAEGIGDVAEHERAAKRHRDAAITDRDGAAQDDADADAEED